MSLLCNQLSATNKSICLVFQRIEKIYIPCIHIQYICSPLYSAVVWGSSVKHNPQRVGKDHVLNDEDILQLVKK